MICMKTSKTTAFAAIFTLLAFFAPAQISSQSSLKEEADRYEATDLTGLKEKQLQKRPQKNASSFAVDDTPIQLGEGSVFEYNLLNTDVQQSSVSYMYYPKENAVVLKISNALAKYFLLFDANDRAVCHAAYKQYLEDFSAKVLMNKPNKTHNIYGEFTGEYRTGFIGTATITKPKVTVGYRFVKKSPYFTLTFWPAAPEPVVNGIDVNKPVNSDKMTFLMTKKQAGELVKYMDEDFINGIRQENVLPIESADKY